MIRDDFILYILSHHRANKIDTLMMLKKYNYTGKFFVVISDDDDIQSYIDTVGKDNVLVFNKQDYMNKYDSMDNYCKQSIAFYARNFINEHAKGSGVTYYAQFDDDIDKLFHRYIDGNGKLKRKEVENIDDLLQAHLEFLDSSDVLAGCCFALDSGYFGGANGRFKQGMGRKIYQTMILKVNCQVPWKGSHYEDMLLSALNINNVYLDMYSTSFSSPKMSSNTGGIDYSSIFDATVYLKVALGDKIVLYPDGKTLIRNNILFPKIISYKFKKES